jgi:hypothetical protein
LWDGGELPVAIGMVDDILRWQAASAAFFVYCAAAGVLLPRLSSGGRLRATAGAVAGLALTLASLVLDHRAYLHEWLLPPTLLLVGYWTSGALFIAPMPRAEAALLRIDAALRVRRAAARLPRGAAELLELSYTGVYPLIPVALVLHLTLTPDPDPDRFWSVVLVTDYICFATLPWLQTRPPRAIEGGPPWGARLRAVNVRLLSTASIHANTFPSGHAAEALAAALLVTGAPAAVVACMFGAALAVSAGAVLGRYHYALDAVAGWIVALVVWVVLKS